MIPKILHWLGLAACITLIVSCFMPWVYCADIQETFTGLYSFKNNYGKPGKFMVLLTTLIILGMLKKKVWTKRVNLFLAALLLGYAIKSYVLFTSCYNAYCPEKLLGVYLMITSSVVIMVSAIFPDMKLITKSKEVKA
jgi:hypothetical protein